MTVATAPRFGTEERHVIRELVYDSLIQNQVVRGDDIMDIKIQLGLMDLSNKQVYMALSALRYKHHLISLRRPQLGRMTRGWAIRKLSD